MQPNQFHKSFVTCFAVAALLLLDSAPLWSQQVTAAITGRVSDTSHAAIVGAKVTASDTERGSTFSALTNGDGVYYMPRLPVGTYIVRAEQQGFKAVQQAPITLVLNQTARLDFELQVGSLSQS